MATDVLLKPIITEKMTILGEKLNQYAFKVDRKANKVEIKKAVERMYNVSVVKVRTVNMPAKATARWTKAGVIKGRKSAYKKAIVTLAEGDTIDFYSNI